MLEFLGVKMEFYEGNEGCNSVVMGISIYDAKK